MGQSNQFNVPKTNRSRRIIILVKKRHTRKHLVMTDQNKRVLVLSKARVGKVHDKPQLNEEKLADFVPDDIPIHVDLGFQG